MISELMEFGKLLRQSRWPRARLEQLRHAKLCRLIHHAYENVPYYRALMERSGVTPGDISGPGDLAKLPVTTKADLRNAGDDCLARGHGRLTTLHTSGHSGTPFNVYMTPAEYRTRRLREFRMTIAAGVRARDRLTLLGPMRERPDRFHRKLGLYRLEVIPGMLPVEELTRKLRDSRPDVLWVYPTVLKTVLNFVQCELYELVRPRILITSSQVMAPVFRDQLLAANAGMEIVDIYGSAEAGRIAAVCPARQGLHVEEDALILELLNDGQAAEAGAHGTVVLTCLDQFAMPLIRYEQGDLCRFLPDGCSCGRQTPLLEPPIGRNADMITLPSGRKISCFRLDVALRHETTLRQYRFVQERLDHIEAQLCFTQDPTAERMHEIRRCLESQMEEGQTLSIRVVPELQLTGLKFKVFVSRLN